MRTELPQEVVDLTNEGAVQVFHTNAWTGERLTGQHQGGDLPPELANKALEMARELLRKGGWEANGSETKILMLTHKRLADQQKYRDIADCFEYNDAFVKKQDPHIKYFADTVEPAWIAYQAKQYGQFLTIIGGRSYGSRRQVISVSAILLFQPARLQSLASRIRFEGCRWRMV